MGITTEWNGLPSLFLHSLERLCHPEERTRSAKEPHVPMKILIADADAAFTRKVTQTLESRGHYVAEEADPPAALARALRWKPDVVLVNAAQPPVADGDLLEQLARIHPRPAVLLTANLDEFAIAWRAWQRGGDEVLLKPVLRASEIHVAIAVAIQNSLVGRRGDRQELPVARSA